ncbi:nucleotidyltransferase domain-containing protein [Paenibacillus sp. CMAA1364]
MKPWEVALDLFLENWKNKEEVIGILVCGSYITGNPSKRSDIDVHIILSDDHNWRERGNQYVKGFLIEYFVNPPQQIRSYFKADYYGRSTMSMVQFLTGRIVLDKSGIVEQLVEDAKGWKSKPYTDLDKTIVEITKYGLWDALDNLLDCYEEGRIDFEFVYNSSLLNLYNVYCSILNIEKVPSYHISRYLTEPLYLKKYLKQPFPDSLFGQLYIEAMKVTGHDEMISIFRKLTEYVFDQSGGFNIDGWRFRSEISIEN